MSGLVEEHNWKGLKIVFAKKFLQQERIHIRYSTVLSGATILFICRGESMAEVKDKVRVFLRDPDSIEKVIKKNHTRFLTNKGVKNAEKILLYAGKSQKNARVTKCYGCGHNLSSFRDFCCAECKWLLCTCGACGCGYQQYL